MGDLWDASGTMWRNLIGKAGAKAGYDDGYVSAWPPEAWDAFPGDALLHFTVLANPGSQAFDAETGNAGAGAVASAIALRHANGLWSAGYTNEALFDALTAALHARGLGWSSAEHWPAPGVYLFAADPSRTGWYRTKAPGLTPVAVQDQWTPLWDHSTTYGTFPAVPAPPPPPAPPRPQEARPVFIAIAPPNQYLVFDNGTKAVLHSAQDGSNLANELGLKGVELDPNTVAGIPDAAGVSP